MPAASVQSNLLFHALVKTCQAVHAGGFTPATSGNISVRDDAGTLHITPSGYAMREVLGPEHVVSLHPDGRLDSITPGLTPSSELPLHRAIYAACPEVNAIIHAHPLKATTLCIAGIPLDQPLLAETLLWLGEVPMVPYLMPGSDALAESVAEALKTHPAVMLANHGVFTTGADLRQALYRLELLESLAEMTITAKLLGRINVLTPEQVAEIREVHGG